VLNFELMLMIKNIVQRKNKIDMIKKFKSLVGADGDDSDNHNKLQDKTKSAPPMYQSSIKGDPHNNEYGKRFLQMSLEEKRMKYRCRDSYQTLEHVPLWPVLAMVQPYKPNSQPKYSKVDRDFKNDRSNASLDINKKISLWQGDITRLEIDAIVNAANTSLLGGGGVDGSIHRGAGPTLKKECQELHGAHTGEAKITSGHLLPAKYVIHTVGPVGKSPQHLYNCYKSCFDLMLQFKIRSIAFCCVSTGVYGYPNRDAAYIALKTARNFMDVNHEKVDRIIFCTYLSVDFEIYKELMATKYFPCSNKAPVENDELSVMNNDDNDDIQLIKKIKKQPSEDMEVPIVKVKLPSETSDDSSEDFKKHSKEFEKQENMSSKIDDDMLIHAAVDKEENFMEESEDYNEKQSVDNAVSADKLEVEVNKNVDIKDKEENFIEESEDYNEKQSVDNAVSADKLEVEVNKNVDIKDKEENFMEESEDYNEKQSVDNAVSADKLEVEVNKNADIKEKEENFMEESEDHNEKQSVDNAVKNIDLESANVDLNEKNDNASETIDLTVDVECESLATATDSKATQSKITNYFNAKQK